MHRIAEAAALISVAAQTLNLTIPHVDEKLEFAYLFKVKYSFDTIVS